MTFLLNQIFQFIKLLNSDKGTTQIAAGISCGWILGLTPALSLQTFLIYFVLFFFRIQIGAALFTTFLFMFPAYLLDPLFDSVGGRVLELDALRPLYVTLADLPLVPLTRFSNTIVMGSFVVALATAPLVFLASQVVIAQYRNRIVARFEQTKLWKAVQATGFYKWYVKYESLKGYAG
jgi:uncharacterized protein (TIGR03546 family)